MAQRAALAIAVTPDAPEEALANLHSTFRNEDVAISYDGIRIGDRKIAARVHQDDLRTDRTLGRGACSSVQRARHKETGEFYALKIFSLYDKDRRAQLMKEIKLLSQCQCPAIVTFFGAYHNDGNISVVLEFMDRGTLENFIKEDITLPEDVIAGMTYQILWGLGYLHCEGRVHRDIKPTNILINSKGEVKLSDFGISTALNEGSMAETMVGTFWYMSPERLLGENYDTSSDLWSLGLVLIELYTKEFPFRSADTPIDMIETLREITTDELVPDDDYPPLMAALVRSCLEFDPSRRQNAQELLASPWFAHHGIDALPRAISTIQEWLESTEDEGKEELIGSCTSTYSEEKLVTTLNSEPSDDEEDDIEDSKADRK